MKIGDWQLKRLDKDVIQERRNFVVHPAYTIIKIER